MQSFVSIQVLSGIICFFCTAYLLISTFYPSSFQNIIGGLRFQPSLGPVTLLVNVTKSNTTKATATIPATKSTINPTVLGTESYICDTIQKPIEHPTSNFSFQSHRQNALRPYCDILPSPRNKWVSAKRYVESDIVFLIYTGSSFYHTRATSTRDTWLSRVTHKYFLSATPYPSLPVTVIEGAGENYKSNMRKLYLGMQIAFREHNNTAKFYYLAGCDTFINIHHILKRLEGFDSNKPSIIGGYPFWHVCYTNKKQTAHGVQYPSGGAGFFLSHRMMEMMYPKLTHYFENEWPIDDQPYSDVAVNCLAHSLGVNPSLVPGFWAFSPEQTIKDGGRQALHQDGEPNTFHYVKPDSMYILDEFYVFQHVDRLANDRNLDELVNFTRRFIAAHYELLRIKRSECTLPTVKTTRK